MNQGNDRQAAVILSLIGIIPVVWLGLLIAPSVKGGLPEILTSLMNAMNAPFHIELCEDSVKAVLVLLFCYGMGVGIYFSTRRNYRRREEHGSAKWGSASAVNKKYAQQPKSENKLLTQNVAIGLNAKKHRRNLNTLVIGGSGAGKTRFFCKPNLMQCCRNSYFVLDPKGEIVRDVGELLSQKGYEVRVLDLISMEKSHCYNPFVYLQSDNDIQRLVTNLFKATTPKGSQSNDPFWDTSASMLLSALVCPACAVLRCGRGKDLRLVYGGQEAGTRPELFIRFAIAKGAITYGMELMLALFNIVQGTISTIMSSAGFSSPQQTTLPAEMITTIEDCGFFESIPLWAVTLIGGLFITVMSFILIMTVYGRFFKLYMYTALAPIPLSTFAGEPSQNVGKSFIKSYCAVCLEGAVIVLSCIIFSLFASSPPVVNPDAAAVTQVWSYVGELLFNMLVLVGAVKMSDRIIREMMGL